MTKSQFVWEVSAFKNQQILWCDEEYIERIKALGGVATVRKWAVAPCYTVVFNPRYVMREVMDAIEAIITEG